MNNVIDLNTARERASALAADESFFTDVDFRYVTRHSHSDGKDGFLDDVNDAITLGPIAEQQVRQIFWLHGLRCLPETWAELMGNLNYCSLLDSWLVCFSSSQPNGMRALATTDHNQQCPGRGELLGLLADGDLDGAWMWHQQQGTFTKNSLDEALTASSDE